MENSFKSYNELVAFFKDKKSLIITNDVHAKSILTKTGYFSLILGYSYIFKNPTTGIFRSYHIKVLTR